MVVFLSSFLYYCHFFTGLFFSPALGYQIPSTFFIPSSPCHLPSPSLLSISSCHLLSPFPVAISRCEVSSLIFFAVPSSFFITSVYGHLIFVCIPSTSFLVVVSLYNSGPSSLYCFAISISCSHESSLFAVDIFSLLFHHCHFFATLYFLQFFVASSCHQDLLPLLEDIASRLFLSPFNFNSSHCHSFMTVILLAFHGPLVFLKISGLLFLSLGFSPVLPAEFSVLLQHRHFFPAWYLWSIFVALFGR